MTDYYEMLEAIDASLAKWKAIKNSHISVSYGIKKCSLCELYIRENCRQCPLYLTGNGCLECDSNWVGYEAIAKGYGCVLNEVSPLSHARERLELHINIMITNLKQARDWILGRKGEN